MMLSSAENEVLTRVGPGTLTGELCRRYWTPALLSNELVADGAPVRVRLLGEDLVAFRNSDGDVGLLQEACPHRRASLGLAMNEENGLRCLYHGYKFDIAGRCSDTPTEPAGSRFYQKIRATSYPCREAGGVVWTYMGPAGTQPDFPRWDFLEVPDGHCAAFKVLEECNYAQAVEGTIDSAHAGVLHKTGPWSAAPKLPHEKDLAPKIEIEFTSYGLRYAGLRRIDEDSAHARVTAVPLPFWTVIPPDGAGPRAGRKLANAFVPRDDVSTWHIQFFYDETAPIDVAFRIEEGGHWTDSTGRKLLNIDNWYEQDRLRMRDEEFSGIRGIMTQDHAVNETQGPIMDRSAEHLGTSDIALIAWRRIMLKSARALAEHGTPPPGSQPGASWQSVTSTTVRVPDGISWKDFLPLQPQLVAPKS
jgi:phthalate 4,5-dioxygenase oxygenase subunit